MENPDQLNVSMLKDNMYYTSSIMESSKHTISFMTISSSIERYLNLLELKCSNSPVLKNKILEIRSRYNLAKSKLKQTKKQLNRRLIFILLGAVVLLIGLFSFIFYMVSREKDTIKIENARLEIIVEKINESVAEGKIDYAILLCSQLDWNDQGLSGDQDEEMEKKWSSKKAEMLKVIETIKK